MGKSVKVALNEGLWDATCSRGTRTSVDCTPQMCCVDPGCSLHMLHDKDRLPTEAWGKAKNKEVTEKSRSQTRDSPVSNSYPSPVLSERLANQLRAL